MRDPITEYLTARLELVHALVEGRESPVGVAQLGRLTKALDTKWGKAGAGKVHARSLAMVREIFGLEPAPRVAQLSIDGLAAVEADIAAEQLVESARRSGIRRATSPTWRDEVNRGMQAMVDRYIADLETRAKPTPQPENLQAMIDAAVDRALSARLQLRNGPGGPLSPMYYRAVWKAGENYEPGDTVTYSGTSWHCGLPTTSRPGSNADWQMMGKGGASESKARAAGIYEQGDGAR